MSMETVLFIGHTEPDGSLSKTALEALEAARGLGGTLVAGLVGDDIGRAAEVIAGCGAARLLAVEGEAFRHSRYSTDAAAAEAIVRASGATLVLAAHSSRWARTLPGVAQRVGGRIDTHITSIGGGNQVTRWYYRQRMEATLARQARPWFLLLESGCSPAYSGAAAPVSIDRIAVEAGPALTRSRVTGRQNPQAGEQTIRPDAELLFVAGAGWTKKQKDGQAHPEEAARLISSFVHTAKASLGSSKSLVDLSGEGQTVLPFLSHLNQVGQTGSTPRHPKGLATCCHGEEPHVVGWRFIKERRAVNLDPNCGWARGKADILYVADAFAVIGRVNALLESRACAATTATDT
jgi:electron transfer flavoprotein alpha subunit